jgi:hypothetical protein
MVNRVLGASINAIIKGIKLNGFHQTCNAFHERYFLFVLPTTVVEIV